MFCGKCGKQIPNGARRCMWCGADSTVIVAPEQTRRTESYAQHEQRHPVKPPVSVVDKIKGYLSVFPEIFKKYFPQMAGLIVSTAVIFMLFGITIGNTTSSNGERIVEPNVATEEPTVRNNTEHNHTGNLDAEIIPTAEGMIALFYEELPGALGDDESITKIYIEEHCLVVVIDLGPDPSPLTYDMLLESRTGSITDTILGHPEFDDLWETITIDSGGHGKIICDKSMIVINEYGMRYFDRIYYINLGGYTSTTSATEATIQTTTSQSHDSVAPSGYCYVSENGKKYHSFKSCSGMNPLYAKLMTIDEAISRGYGKCKNCW